MLLGNYSVYNRGPVFNVTGAAQAKMPSMFSMSGRRRNRYYVDMSTTANAVDGLPYGNTPPASWMIPQKAGAMKARVIGDATVTGTAYGGLAAECVIAGTSDVTAFCSLIAGMTCQIDGVATFTGDLRAILNCVANISGTATVTANMFGDGFMLSAMTGTGDASLTSYAVGHMGCAITPFTDLSPQNLAYYVWQATAADNNDIGTMGEKLNSAGSGSSPTDIANAVWSKTLP